MPTEYEISLRRARSDLKAAYSQRQELDLKIAKLRQTVVSLGTLCEESDETMEFLKKYVPKSGNLTDSVENAILGSNAPLGPIDLRDLLTDLGYRFQSSNPLASIHSVIKRLVEQKKIVPVRPVKSDGTVKGDRKYWHGMSFSDPPKPWVTGEQVVWDKEKRSHVVKPGVDWEVG